MTALLISACIACVILVITIMARESSREDEIQRTHTEAFNAGHDEGAAKYKSLTESQARQIEAMESDKSKVEGQLFSVRHELSEMTRQRDEHKTTCEKQAEQVSASAKRLAELNERLNKKTLDKAGKSRKPAKAVRAGIRR